MIGAVGPDPLADEALAGLREAGVALELHESDEPTGIAVILVDEAGENQIVVAPGANARWPDVVLPRARRRSLPARDPGCGRRERLGGVRRRLLPERGSGAARRRRPRPDGREPLRARGAHSRDGLVAVTLGAEGAILLEDGEEVARAAPPEVVVVDGTAAGDAFTACLLVSLLEERDYADALRRACAAGALAASREGAQPSLPTAAEIDAILS